MKKYMVTLLLLLLVPFIVNAKTCNNNKISISSITLENKSEYVTELDEATVNGKNINLNLEMGKVGDIA